MTPDDYADAGVDPPCSLCNGDGAIDLATGLCIACAECGVLVEAERCDECGDESGECACADD